MPLDSNSEFDFEALKNLDPFISAALGMLSTQELGDLLMRVKYEQRPTDKKLGIIYDQLIPHRSKFVK